MNFPSLILSAISEPQWKQQMSLWGIKKATTENLKISGRLRGKEYNLSNNLLTSHVSFINHNPHFELCLETAFTSYSHYN